MVDEIAIRRKANKLFWDYYNKKPKNRNICEEKRQTETTDTHSCVESLQKIGYASVRVQKKVKREAILTPNKHSPHSTQSVTITNNLVTKSFSNRNTSTLEVIDLTQEPIPKFRPISSHRLESNAARIYLDKFVEPLCEEDERMVNEAFRAGSDYDVIANFTGKSPICRSDMAVLQPGKWLNNFVIDAYFSLLCQRDIALCSDNDSRKRIKFYPCHFSISLMQEDYEFEPKAAGHDDIFDNTFDKLFFIFNANSNHWILVVVFMTEKVIRAYDSMNVGTRSYCKKIFQYLQDVHYYRRNELLPGADDWRLVPSSPNIPKQTNSYDCGVFVCMYADFLSRDFPLLFTQNDITHCRKRIALSIMKGEL